MIVIFKVHRVFNSSYVLFTVSVRFNMNWWSVWTTKIMYRGEQKKLKHFASCRHQTKTIIKLDIGFVASSSSFISLNKFISPVLGVFWLQTIPITVWKAARASNKTLKQKKASNLTEVDVALAATAAAAVLFPFTLPLFTHVQIMEIFLLQFESQWVFLCCFFFVCLFASWLLVIVWYFLCCYLRFFHHPPSFVVSCLLKVCSFHRTRTNKAAATSSKRWWNLR